MKITFHPFVSDIGYVKFIGFNSWKYIVWKNPHDDTTRESGTTYALGFYFFHIGISINDKKES